MKKENQNRLQAAIDAYMVRSGVQMRGLSAIAGLGEKAVQDIMSGRSKSPRIDTIVKLAAAMNVDPNDLLPGPAPSDSSASVPRQSPPPLPPRNEMPRDVPVLGTAMGGNGEGAFELNQTGGIVDMVLRGPGIANSRKVFAIYVEGDSMWPRFRPGALVYCDPSRPPRIGDDVVVVMAAFEPGKPPQAYLKELVRRSASEIVTRQFNPDKEVRFPADQVQQVIRVLTTNEVMGV